MARRDLLLAEAYLHKGIGARERRREPCHQILSVDDLAGLLVVFERQQACPRGKFGSGDLAAHRAGRNFHLRVVANALDLPRLADGHDIEFSVVFPEPHGRGDGDSGLAKCGQRYVFLIMNCGRDFVCHSAILRVCIRKVVAAETIFC
jgi:hypothetical protein